MLLLKHPVFKKLLSKMLVCCYLPVIRDEGHIIKANLNRSRTRAKFCQLIASSSVFILFIFVLKIRLKGLLVIVLSV